MVTTNLKISHRERHRLVRDLFRPIPIVYWFDFAMSAFIGWSAFVLALLTSSTPVWAVSIALSVFALYRAVLFTHELVHVRRDYLKIFRMAWNLFCGVPLLVPSFLYDGVHQEHHFRKNYGTVSDGEYLPFGSPPRARIFLYLISHLMLPPLIFLRFGLLGPLSWFTKKTRKMVWCRLSSLSIDPAYTRTLPANIPWSWVVQETLCSMYVWTIVVFIYMRILPLEVLLQLYYVSVAVLILNAVRTLAAHRYCSDGQAMSFEEQLADSVNITSGKILTPLLAPVGLRYHALHHLFPTIPYHNLGKAHCRLVSKLPDDPVYKSTMARSVWQALHQLWWASGDRSMHETRVSP